MTDNNNSTIQKGKKRGPKQKLNDNQLKDLVLEVKKKYKNQQLTYLLLERETNIGRNTWKRRLEDFIKEINKPILRDFDFDDSDEIYFPNIENIFEACGNNKQRIINELHEFELLFQKLYEERNALKSEVKKLEGFKQKKEEYKNRIAELQQDANNYRTLYEQMMASSTYVHLRDKMGIEKNLLDFNEHIEKNISLTNLQQHFPNLNDDIEDQADNIKERNMDRLKGEFNNLF
ncbi:hypothetical protein [Priestia megaterium]